MLYGLGNLGGLWGRKLGSRLLFAVRLLWWQGSGSVAAAAVVVGDEWCYDGNVGERLKV